MIARLMKDEEGDSFQILEFKMRIRLKMKEQNREFYLRHREVLRKRRKEYYYRVEKPSKIKKKTKWEKITDKLNFINNNMDKIIAISQENTTHQINKNIDSIIKRYKVFELSIDEKKIEYVFKKINLVLTEYDSIF